MRIVVHPEAAAELRGAAHCYEERRSGLGSEFLAEVDAALSRISRAPASFARWPGTGQLGEPIRRVVLERFPYAIAFEVHQEYILTLAIAHAKRRPLYWINRAIEGFGDAG